jgi:hypothetical protein
MSPYAVLTCKVQCQEIFYCTITIASTVNSLVAQSCWALLLAVSPGSQALRFCAMDKLRDSWIPEPLLRALEAAGETKWDFHSKLDDIFEWASVIEPLFRFFEFRIVIS